MSRAVGGAVPHGGRQRPLEGGRPPTTSTSSASRLGPLTTADALVDRGAEVDAPRVQADPPFAVGRQGDRSRACLFGQCDAAADGLYRVPDELHQLIGQCRAIGARRLLRDAERADALDDVLHETTGDCPTYRQLRARRLRRRRGGRPVARGCQWHLSGTGSQARHHLSAPPTPPPHRRRAAASAWAAPAAAAEYAAACGAARQMWGVDVRAAPASPPAARSPDVILAAPSSRCAGAVVLRPGGAPPTGGEQVITAAQWAIFDKTAPAWCAPCSTVRTTTSQPFTSSAARRSSWRAATRTDGEGTRRRA